MTGKLVVIIMLDSDKRFHSSHPYFQERAIFGYFAREEKEFHKIPQDALDSLASFTDVKMTVNLLGGLA